MTIQCLKYLSRKSLSKQTNKQTNKLVADLDILASEPLKQKHTIFPSNYLYSTESLTMNFQSIYRSI